MQTKIPVKIPIANLLNTASRSLAVTAIAGYQKFISPHKGFSCAHRVLYGCESCSQYFKQVIAEDGILTAIANAKGRFQECREANEILKRRRAKCRARRYASRMQPNSNNIHNIGIVAIESGDIPENPDLPENPENPADQQKLGGAQWSRKNRQIKESENGKDNNNCLDYLDCGDLVDCSDVCSAMPDLHCSDISCPDLNCGNTDCLSGLDCNGCGDCGGADCGSLDCGGCG